MAKQINFYLNTKKNFADWSSFLITEEKTCIENAKAHSF